MLYLCVMILTTCKYYNVPSDFLPCTKATQYKTPMGKCKETALEYLAAQISHMEGKFTMTTILSLLFYFLF